MILSARNLKKTFQDGDNTLQVLKGVNFDLDKGDILTIKGASGSGKSTLLSLLGTLDQPDTGEIIIDNNNLKTINNYDSIRNKHIGFVFQFHNLIAELNIIENVTIQHSLQVKIMTQIISTNYLNILIYQIVRNLFL